MSGEERIAASIFRYDPDKDVTPRYENFVVQYRKNMTVLGVLRYIYEHLDGSLAFDHECRNGYCGICAVLVNKEPVLACKTPASKEMMIEPLPNFPIVRDLIVDRSFFNERIDRVRPFIERATPPALEPEELRPEEFKIHKTLSRCVRCSSCYSICPVVTDAAREFGGPTSMVEIAKYAFDPRDNWTRSITAYQEGVFNCVGCSKCKKVCPSEIPIFDIIARMRGQVLDREIGPFKQVNEIEERILSTGRPFKRISIEPTFLEQAPSIIEAENPVDRVAFFVGCHYGTYSPRYHKIAKSVVNVLWANGVSVVIPREQICCGLPLLQTGSTSTIQKIAKRNIDILKNTRLDTVVTACPGCGITLKNEYPKIIQEDLPFRVKDISEYLSEASVLNTKSMKKLDLKVTYHDPCHLKYGIGVSLEPRKLLQSIPGLELIEMEEADRCCGGGGEVRVLNLRLAREITKKKSEMIRKLNVDTVVASCPFCKMQIEDAFRLSRMPTIRIFHVVELVAMAYEMEPFVKHGAKTLPHNNSPGQSQI